VIAQGGVGIAMATTAKTAWAKGPVLSWRDFPTNESGFFRAPVLLSGQHEAVLVDGGFTLSDGRALAEAIRASGKTLTTIYISQSDPDYYFSLGPVKAAFPAARIVAASATITAIRGNVEKKLVTWGPQLKDNGPQKLSDIVMPEAYDHPTLDVEGHHIQIVDAERLASGAATDVTAIHYTRDYLLAFEEELAKAADSGALIAAMTRRYPNVGGGGSLQLGAKVAKGEMKWG